MPIPMHLEDSLQTPLPQTSQGRYRNARMNATISEYITHARTHSAFYKDLYSNLPEGELQLEQLPVLDPKKFWEVNPSKSNALPTYAHQDGIIFQSGGTTGDPKTCLVSKAELKMAAQNFAKGMVEAGLKPGDRIANLFVAGDLYSSFLLVSFAVLECPIPAVLLPLGFGLSIEKMILHCRNQSATVIMGIATTITKIAADLLKNNETLPKVTLLLFAGEHLYADQKTFIKKAFPHAEIQSCSYGSMDSGMLGIPVEYEGDARIHRINHPTTVLEIVDAEEKIITDNHEPGTLLVTNLTRRLCPVIRYPVGDMAEWIDREAGLFRVLGRDQAEVRVGVVSVEAQQLRSLPEQCLSTEELESFRGMQVILERRELKDQMIFALACNPPDKEAATKKMIDGFHEKKPWFKEHVAGGMLQPLEIKWISPDELEVTARTGKTPLLLDRRM